MLTYNDSRISLHKLWQIPWKCQCKWLLRFLVGPKNICKLFSVSREVFVLHGYDWIHWLAKSCTTTAYRRLFRDSHPSQRTLWSAVIKSPTFSARGTASPVRRLHGALAILVLMQMSQFRSFGKWVWILCLPTLLSLAALMLIHEKSSQVRPCTLELFRPQDFP